MKVLLLGLGFCLIVVSSRSDAAEVSGDWVTIYMAADNVDVISENAEMRLLFRHLECSEGSDKVTFNFYVKSLGVCKKHTVVATKTFDDIYVARFAGINVFKIQYLSDNTIAFYDNHLDENGRLSHLTLVASKGDSLSEEERQRYENMTENKNIPKENIRNLIDTDNCPAA